MARDRLAQIKGGGQQGSQAGFDQPYNQSYPSPTTRQPPSNPQVGSYNTAPSPQQSQPRQQPGYNQQYSPQYSAGGQDSGRYAPPSSLPPPVQSTQQEPLDENTKFFNDIGDIRTATAELTDNINRIQTLHQRQLDTLANDPQHDSLTAQLAQITDETRQLSNSLKSAIKRLEAQTSKKDPRDPNTNVRRSQVGAVKQRFLETIQRYQTVEQESRKKQRQKMERQFKIVKPEATQDEVNAALDSSGQSNRIFEQALLNSNRYGDARAAYKEVQDRHVEIVKIEQTITELAQMFQDMAMMVEEQEPALVHVEEQAVDAETNMKGAEIEMQKAVKSARAARRKRWICFVVILIILIAIAIGLAVHFTNQKK